MAKAKLVATLARVRVRGTSGGGCAVSSAKRSEQSLSSDKSYTNTQLQMRANTTQPFVDFKHFSDSTMPVFRTPLDLNTGVKPKGCLWLSCGNAWLNFDNGWAGSYRYEYDVRVVTSGLIILDSREKLDEFYDQYGGQKRDICHGHYYYEPKIDWNRARTDNPDKCGVYLPKFNSDEAIWSDGWDLCSAALWSDSCINNVRLNRTNASVHDR